MKLALFGVLMLLTVSGCSVPEDNLGINVGNRNVEKDNHLPPGFIIVDKITIKEDKWMLIKTGKICLLRHLFYWDVTSRNRAESLTTVPCEINLN